MGLDFLIAAGLKILEKVIPDPAAKAEAQYRLLQLQQTGELAALQAEVQLATGQTEVNKIEAGSVDHFVSRWRPAIGWICGLGLFYQFLGWPIFSWISSTTGIGQPPQLDLGDLITILLGMLGLSSLRTVEKVKGAA